MKINTKQERQQNIRRYKLLKESVELLKKLKKEYKEIKSFNIVSVTKDNNCYGFNDKYKPRKPM